LQKSEISRNQILKWVNLADLLRPKGFAEAHFEPLDETGMNMVSEPEQRKPANR